jgi:hypothetical protein
LVFSENLYKFWVLKKPFISFGLLKNSLQVLAFSKTLYKFSPSQKLFINFGFLKNSLKNFYLLKNAIPCLSIYNQLTLIPNFIPSQILSDIIIPFYPRSRISPYCSSSLVCYSFHRSFLSSVLNMPKLSYSLCLYTSYCGYILTNKSISSLVLILHLQS